MKLPKGKYKHLVIQDIDDLQYLQWAYLNMQMATGTRAAVREQINTLKYLLL